MSKLIAVRIPEELVAQMKATGRPTSEIVVAALKMYLNYGAKVLAVWPLSAGSQLGIERHDPAKTKKAPRKRTGHNAKVVGAAPVPSPRSAIPARLAHLRGCRCFMCQPPKEAANA